MRSANIQWISNELHEICCSVPQQVKVKLANGSLPEMLAYVREQLVEEKKIAKRLALGPLNP